MAGVNLDRGSWELRALNYLINYCGKEMSRFNSGETRDEFVIVDYGLNEESQLEVVTGYVDENGKLSKNWTTNYFDIDREGLEFAFDFLGIDEEEI